MIRIVLKGGQTVLMLCRATRRWSVQQLRAALQQAQAERDAAMSTRREHPRDRRGARARLQLLARTPRRSVGLSADEFLRPSPGARAGGCEWRGCSRACCATVETDAESFAYCDVHGRELRNLARRMAGCNGEPADDELELAMLEARSNGGHATRSSPSRKRPREPRSEGAAALQVALGRIAKLEATAARSKAKRDRKDEFHFPAHFSAAKKAAVLSRFEDLCTVRDIFDEAHVALVEVESGAAADAAMASETLTKMRNVLSKGLCTCDLRIAMLLLWVGWDGAKKLKRKMEDHWEEHGYAVCDAKQWSQEVRTLVSELQRLRKMEKESAAAAGGAAAAGEPKKKWRYSAPRGRGRGRFRGRGRGRGRR